MPWVKGVGQRGYDENDLPQDSEKRALYEVANSLLEEAGYLEVGMDHFALPHDSLAVAMQNKTLHRNFMGYTTQHTSILLGLGMSSISDSWFGFAQNEKTVEDYQERVNRGELPVFRGHILSPEELLIRRHILDLMCHFETQLSENQLAESINSEIIKRLQPMIEDELVTVENGSVQILQKGLPYVRNACMAFDQDLATNVIGQQLFSKTI